MHLQDSEGVLWRRLREEVVRYLLKRSRDRALADDLAQEVFLRYHGKGSQLKDSAKLRNWLFRIASHLVVDHYRLRRRQSSHLPDVHDSTHEAFNACAADCLRQELNSLPDAYRTLLQRSELEEVSQLRLAEDFQLSYSGLKSRVQRGRKMLKERLQQKYLLEADPYGNITRCESRTPAVICVSC